MIALSRPTITLLMSLLTACGAPSDGDAAGETEGDTTAGTTTEGGTTAATTGASAGGSTVATGGSTGGPELEPIDPSSLDRSEEGACGFPGPGPNGYGPDEGQRFPNFSLQRCSGESFDFDTVFCQREDAYGDYNRAVLVSVVSMWCDECQAESTEWSADLYPELHGEGLEIVQLIARNVDDNPPTLEDCDTWAADHDASYVLLVDPTLLVPITLDPDDLYWTLPARFLLDANGNVRWAREGGQSLATTRERILEVFAEPYGP